MALSQPEIRSAVTKNGFSFAPRGKSARVARTTDQLLFWFRLPGVTTFGGKTGYIDESGYNLVFAAGIPGHDLIGVVLGSENNNARFEEMSKLLKWVHRKDCGHSKYKREPECIFWFMMVMFLMHPEPKP